jgi:excisionase family DNA binding protein
MKTVTLETMPQAIAELSAKVDKLLEYKNQDKRSEENPKKLMTVEELCEYLPDQPVKQTIYGYIWRNAIPYKKLGKRVFFRKDLINKWLDNGRQMNFELLKEVEADY